MKFYNSIGPNPRAVRMFIAEKGLTVPMVEVDLMKGENRQDALQDRRTTPVRCRASNSTTARR